MIELTRLNGTSLFLNSDLIKSAEASPDTVLTLINGEKIMVRESCADVMERIQTNRARLLAQVAGLVPNLNLTQLAVAAGLGATRENPQPAEADLTDITAEAMRRRRRETE